MGLADMPLIQSVGRDTYEPYYQHIWYPGGVEWYLDRCFNADSLTTELADPNVAYYLPRDKNGEIVGLLKLLMEKPTPDGSIANALYLEKIYLMPAFFGRGAGQALMAFAVEKAAALGRQAVWLMVLKNGPVQAYARAGFQTTGEVVWKFDLLREAERGGWVMVREI